MSCQTAPPTPASAAAPAAKDAGGVNKTDENRSAPSKPSEEVRSVSPVIDAEMSREFVDAFGHSKECREVQRWTKGEKGKPDFWVKLSFAKADTPEMEEEWLWTVFDIRRGDRDFRGSGTTDSPSDAARDMCKNVLENFKPRRREAQAR